MKRVNKNRPLTPGDRLLLPLSAVKTFQERKENALRQRLESSSESGLVEQIRRSIVYEDASLIVVDKPAGLSCHSGKGVHVSLDDIAVRLDPPASSSTPRLVNRLDKNVSGCVLLAKTHVAANQLMHALKAKTRRHTVR